MRMKSISAFIASALALIVLADFGSSTVIASSPIEPLEVIFSHNSGFYDESFDLVLNAPPGATVRYSLGGNLTALCSVSEFYTNPPQVSDTRYTAPIPVSVGEEVDVFTIRAYATRGSEVSEVVVRNFIRGHDVRNRFCENTLVFTLNSDPHGLNDHHDGIFEFGVDRERWRQEQFDRTGRWPTRGWNAPQETPAVAANFNRSGEESGRRVYLEMFEYDGRLRLSQDVEMRVKGGFSRSHSQKTIEFYARDESGEWEFFDYPFFWENSMDGNLMHRYRRIRLRNGGSDRHGAFLRDELCHDLLRQAGLPNTQNHTPAAIFINGEYYGVSWIKTPRTENNLRRRYGGETANFRRLQGSENGYNSDFWEGEEDAVTSWREEVFHYATSGDGRRLTDDNRWRIFQERVCIDNLMLYYAFNIYSQNLDWPNHNMEMWRYFPTEDERSDPTLHPHLRDGRWRWMPHDLEASFFANGAAPSVNSIHNFIHPPSGGWGGGNTPNWQGQSALLRAVLQREEMRGRFANTMIDLIEGACAAANVERTLDNLIGRIDNEHRYALSREVIAVNWPNYPETNPVSMSSVVGNREQIREFARARPAHMLGFVERPWAASTNSGLGFAQNARSAITLTTSSGGGAVMNSRPVSESSSEVANYYNNTTVTITAQPYPGYVISHWVVGGTRMDSRPALTMNITRPQSVELHFAKAPGAHLRISAISSTGVDWLELHNPTDTRLSARGLYLSDSNNDFFKWRLPAILVQPNSTVLVRMRNNTEDSAGSVKHMQTGFNIAFRETLRITDHSGTVLQAVDVTLLRRGEVQRMANDGNWYIDRSAVPPRPEPPRPEPTNAIPVRLMAQDSTDWARRQSPVVRITGNDIYTATLTLPSTPNLVSLALASDGAGFNWPDGFAGVPNAPALFENAQLRVTALEINGIPIGVTRDEHLVRRGDDSAGGGRVNIVLWDGWWEERQQLEGVSTLSSPGSSGVSFALPDGSPMTTITVTFVVSGVPRL